jgi:hypothetical protein
MSFHEYLFMNCHYELIMSSWMFINLWTSFRLGGYISSNSTLIWCIINFVTCSNLKKNDFELIYRLKKNDNVKLEKWHYIVYVCKHIWIRVFFIYLEIKGHNPAYVTRYTHRKYLIALKTRLCTWWWTRIPLF